jgi:hypothetical protein
MAHINKEKTDKALLTQKVWETLHYQIGPTNCGTCEYSNKTKWSKTKGECNLIDKLSFPISSLGICRQHSSFKRKET